jgi:hypothetical protein
MLTERPLTPDTYIAVGFGLACITKNGSIVWDANGVELDQCLTVAQAEEMAMADPDSDWQIMMHGPLRGATYQRQGEMNWVMIEKNNGFA